MRNTNLFCSQGVLATLRHADKFDFPLTAYEIHFWYPEYVITRQKIIDALDVLICRGTIIKREGYYCLRTGLSRRVIEKRLSRLKYSARKWLIAHDAVT